jgi:hypothetical protein
MYANFTVQTSYMVMITQSFKKQWNKTYIQNETWRSALDGYVDAETSLVKNMINVVDVVFHLTSKEIGKTFAE